MVDRVVPLTTQQVDVEEEATDSGEGDGVKEGGGDREGAGGEAKARAGEVEKADVQQATLTLGTCIHTHKHTNTCKHYATYTHIHTHKSLPRHSDKEADSRVQLVRRVAPPTGIFVCVYFMCTNAYMRVFVHM